MVDAQRPRADCLGHARSVSRLDTRGPASLASGTPNAESQNHAVAPGSDLLSLAGQRDRRPGGGAGLRRDPEHGHERRPQARRPRGRRRQPVLVGLRHRHGPARHAERRRRAAPLRLERLLVGALPVGPPPPRRAALLPDPGPALVADPRRRRQGRPARAEAREDDRGRRAREAHRLLAAAHPALRPRRHLPLGARRPERRRPRRRGAARPRQLQPARRLGARPRPAAPGLRRLVEHRLRHRPHQRVGHAEHGRERHRRRAPAERPVRPPAAHLGPAQRRHKQALDLGAEHQMVLELRPAHDPTKAVRVRRRRRLDRRTSRPASGCGSSTPPARHRREGHHDPGRARRRRASCRRCCSRSAPSRRWSPTSP